MLEWKKTEGDAIAPGDVLAEIETDKATMDWEAQDEGFVAKVLVPAGTKDVAVGSPVLVVVEDQVCWLPLPLSWILGSFPCVSVGARLFLFLCNSPYLCCMIQCLLEGAV